MQIGQLYETNESVSDNYYGTEGVYTILILCFGESNGHSSISHAWYKTVIHICIEDHNTSM